MSLRRLSLAKPVGVGLSSPIDIFNSSGTTLRGKIQNLWEPQAAALRDWERIRDEKDIVIKMNTGGGKTLVGLLIAQAIINKSGGKALYVCPTNQLVEQVRQAAKEAGLPSAQYASSSWEDKDVFMEGRGVCITNYAAVFNSLSKFKSEDLAGIIFDDAHVANNALRGQFTITISKSEKAFNDVIKLWLFRQTCGSLRVEGQVCRGGKGSRHGSWRSYESPWRRFSMTGSRS